MLTTVKVIAVWLTDFSTDRVSRPIKIGENVKLSITGLFVSSSSPRKFSTSSVIPSYFQSHPYFVTARSNAGIAEVLSSIERKRGLGMKWRTWILLSERIYKYKSSTMLPANHLRFRTLTEEISWHQKMPRICQCFSFFFNSVLSSTASR